MPGLTMRRLADEAGTDTASLRERFPTRLDLLLLHGRMMDQAVLAGTIPGQGGSARDRIFDVLMRRLDAMQPHRSGILRLFEDMRGDPAIALALAPRTNAGVVLMSAVSLPPQAPRSEMEIPKAIALKIVVFRLLMWFCLMQWRRMVQFFHKAPRVTR